MIDVNENAKKAYKNAIILFLRERIKTDPAIAEACNSEKKTLDGCVEYIISQAKKQAVNNCAFIPDEEVYGWVIHYLIEDSIDSEKNNTKPKNDNLTKNHIEKLRTSSKEKLSKPKKQKPVKTIYDELKELGQTEFDW